jgi:dynein light intermediate chain 2
MSSTKDTPKIERDLWSVMANERLGNKDNSRTTGVILFLGDFGCGKSTIIQSFLKPSVTKEPKPTFALEYSFARKKTAGSVGKSVSQIWELGGEINNPGFLDVPLSARGICDSSVVICCDLSKPQNIFMALKRHFDLLKTVIRKRISEFQVNDQISQIAMLREYAARSLGDHPDANIIKMMEVPVFIIPTKFDLFKNIPLNDRRLIYQIIRFFAHYYGANILTSSNDASQKEVLRGHLSSICFQTPLKAMCDTAAERPLLMSAGSDSFESILLMLKGTDGESKVLT